MATYIRFPSERHKAAVEHLLVVYRADIRVRGALLCGSLARGMARTDSDVDVLVVLSTAPDELTRRTQHGLIAVEETLRTYDGWIEQFSPSRVGDESWGYAYLDGIPLYDPHGEVAQLVTAAREAHETYRTPEHVRAHYRWLWGHVHPKMQIVLRDGDEIEIGWAAAVMTAPLTDTLWAVNGRPLPSRDLGSFQRHLDELHVPPGVSQLGREMLQAPPRDALQMQVRLVELAMSYLLS